MKESVEKRIPEDKKEGGGRARGTILFQIGHAPFPCPRKREFPDFSR